MPVLRLQGQDLLLTLQREWDLQHKEVWYSPFISRTWDHLEETFPFPAYPDPEELPLWSSFAQGLCWARGGSSPRAEAGRQAGRQGAAQVRQGTGRAEDSTKLAHARASQSRSQTSIQDNISSSSVWYRWSHMLFGWQYSSGIGRSATTKKLLKQHGEFRHTAPMNFSENDASVSGGSFEALGQKYS